MSGQLDPEKLFNRGSSPEELEPDATEGSSAEESAKRRPASAARGGDQLEARAWKVAERIASWLPDFIAFDWRAGFARRVFGEICVLLAERDVEWAGAVAPCHSRTLTPEKARAMLFNGRRPGAPEGQR